MGRWTANLAALALCACGSSHVSSDGGADAGSSGPCPREVPAADAPCARDGLECEYGMRTCLTSARCAGGAWQVAAPRCAPPPAGGCPATREAAQGSACPGDATARCEYDSLICTCTNCPMPYPVCMEVDPPVWACEAPNADPACPAATPLLGTACAPEGQICDYGCEEGRRRVCSGGGWTRDSAPGGCPMSTRLAKRDLEHLGREEVDALASQVLRTRLATYEYVDPALSGRRRLGFVLEDAPHAYSVDPERSQVDLYGYASLLLAALQAQERRIEALEREVRSCGDVSAP